MKARIFSKARVLGLSFLFIVVCALQGQDSQSNDKQPTEQKTVSPAGDAEALRKAAQNPVASLISVPIQENWNFGIQPGDRVQNVLNIQPVVPVDLAKSWNLIVRWITPVVWQPVPTQKNIGVYGLGDMVPTFFLSPAKPGALIWGIGPAFQLPTATNFDTGQGKFGVGPSVVLLTQPGHWTIGVLANNVWSVGGPQGRPRINQFLMQYFINYNLEKGWYLTTSPIVTADWRASQGNEWVAPVGGGVGRVCRLGPMPANISVQFFGNAARPAGSSPWGMRLQMAFLFPRKPK